MHREPGKEYFPVENLVETVRKIQSINRTILNHTLKNLLINIVMHFCSGSDTQLSNEFLGREINESADYVKNLLSKLKLKKYLEITGRGRNRKILPGENLFRDCQSLTDLLGDWQSRNGSEFGDCQSPNNDIGDHGSRNLGNPTSAPINNRRYKERRNVVVVLSEKFEFDFDDELRELLIQHWPEKDVGNFGGMIENLFKYTTAKSTDNPYGYIKKAITGNWKIPDCSEKKNNVDPYAADRARIAQAMAETTAAQNLGFKAAG